ncbi:MAG: transposase [Candidatus Omnitrophota bacterium]
MPGNRKSVRLRNYDYTQEGAYYVTVCVNEDVCRGASRSALDIFGRIENGEMILNGMGQIINDSWQWLEKQYKYIKLDEFIVMPNHIHGIVCINNPRMGVIQKEGGSRTAPTVKLKPLGRLIGAFKTVSTKQINIIRDTPGMRLWQRNYYEHVIRDESDLNRIREYITNNPLRWEEDEYYVT